MSLTVQLEISWSPLVSLTVKSHSLRLCLSWKQIRCGSHCCTNAGETLKLNTWFRSVCQGYHWSGCWLVLTQLELRCPLSFSNNFSQSPHARMIDWQIEDTPKWDFAYTTKRVRPHPRWSDFSGSELTGRCPVTLFIWGTYRDGGKYEQI